MKILDKYLFKSILKYSLAALFSLVFVFAFFQFIEELGDVGLKKYTLDIAIKYILLLLPSHFNSLLVLSLLIGTIFALGQLNSNKELQIFQTASISNMKLIEKTIKYPFLISIILILIFEFVYPQSIAFANQIKSYAMGKSIFKESNEVWLKKKNEIFFLSKDRNNNKKYLIKVFKVKNSALESFIDAKGVLSGESLIVSKDSGKIVFDKNKNFTSPIKAFLEKDSKINLNLEEINSLSNDLKTISIFRLLEIVNYSYESQGNRGEIILEIISRIIRPFTLIGMILVAIPFILSLKRNTSIGKRIFLSIAIGTVTHLFTKITSVVWIGFDEFSIVGSILPTLILIFIGMMMIKIKV